ncbi:MAG: AbrB/MazE/SpoVT family DNA-binding domain-containing protein [Spirochaetes bacterium]|nr:MAG: AbrB/MazE/SpoVT family DNA-binding domain-containing protein [Spirochaetota bacterium]
MQVYGVGKVSPKGQIVIPADLRAELGINTGDQLVIAKSKSGEGIVLLKVQVLNRLLSGTRYNID